MTQQWKPTGGRFDVEQLENINEVADLPDLAQLDEAQIYSIRSGEFAPDYVVPWAWDSAEGEYQEWRSTVDGQVIRDIPDSDVYHKIDEGSGDIIADAQGDDTHQGQSTGSLVWVEDSDVAHGWYVELDSDNYIEIQNTENGELVSFDSDWTVGVEIEITNGIPDSGIIWHYSDGTEVFGIGQDENGNGNLAASYWDGSSRANEVAGPAPSAPYNIDLVVQWDSSANDLSMFFDETEQTESDGTSLDDRDLPITIGDRGDGTAGMGGEGVARWAYWNGIVDPSEFTL